MRIKFKTIGVRCGNCNRLIARTKNKDKIFVLGSIVHAKDFVPTRNSPNQKGFKTGDFVACKFCGVDGGDFKHYVVSEKKKRYCAGC